jgi:hypothetical protein
MLLIVGHQLVVLLCNTVRVVGCALRLANALSENALAASELLLSSERHPLKFTIRATMQRSRYAALCITIFKEAE